MYSRLSAQVERYLGELEKQAAVLIQRVWRGHRERRRFHRHKYSLRQHRAAVILQKVVSLHLYNTFKQKHSYILRISVVIIMHVVSDSAVPEAP